MDLDVYNDVGADFADDAFHFGETNIQNDSTGNALSALNDVVRGPPKRMLDPDDCDELDWHMRFNSDNYEKEQELKREMLNNEVIERLSQRISWARKKRRLMDLGEEESKQSTSSTSKKSEVLLYPPSGDTSWIGFTAPSILHRFYIMLRTVDGTVKDRNNEKLRNDVLKFGFTEKVLNSGTAFEVPDIAVEGVKEGSTFFQDKLWVDKYSPQTYTDLISDETVNRLLLNWIKLWDECVFQWTVPDAVLRSTSNQLQLMLNNEKPRRPSLKVVLLAGPAGTGKTTLATLVAQHAGYRVISLNASDERNTVDFEKCFEVALRTTRTLDAGSKPNCLILDEIDGAPTQSIHYLCKAVTATGRHSLRRPVICICNNLYTPSLRELRSIALVLQLSRTDEKRLMKRLKEISKLEHLKIESSALSEIINACSRDLRLSINSLQFIASEGCASVDREAVLKFCEREKQFGEKSLFDSWAAIFEISRHLDANGRIQPAASRVKRITLISEVQGSETDRFYMGIFTNYLNVRSAGLLSNASAVVRHLCYYDRIVTSMNSVQDYNLLKYLSAVCVSVHLLLCCRGRTQLSFPTEYQNAMQRREQSVEIVESVRAGATQWNFSLPTVVLEILPYLIRIVQPNLKPMNTQLYSVRELEILRSIVGIMRTFSLTFTSVSQNGSVSFVFKPPIDQVVIFSESDECHKNRSWNTLSSAAKQLIAHEIELEKLRSDDAPVSVNFSDNSKNRLIKPGKFGRGITFSYNSGSSSAIRRSIVIKNLFSS